MEEWEGRKTNDDMICIALRCIGIILFFGQVRKGGKLQFLVIFFSTGWQSRNHATGPHYTPEVWIFNMLGSIDKIRYVLFE